ncbi:MAG: RNA polymerase factor sigma-54 [Rhodospirillaceae bacterium]|nr:RNA polymerase factor sigma-54 [Rhodospirillaceae bacterium]
MARLASALVQKQAQHLAPAQQQSLAILQLPAGDLAALVEAALAENPFLERQDVPAGDATPTYRQRGNAIGRGGLPVPPVSDIGHQAPATDAMIEAIADPGATSLRGHLIDQLRLEIADPMARTIALHLIDLCADTGYLAGDPGEVATMLGVAREAVDGVLQRLRQFEPAGVFARDLADCLSLQLDADERNDPAMNALLANLPLLASGDRDTLAARCAVDCERLDAMIRRIRGLDPKPGLRFATAATVWTVPDILVERDGSQYRVRVNPVLGAGVALDLAGYRRLSAAARQHEAKDTIRQQFDAARGLLSAIERRAATLLTIAEAIVDRQRGFFDEGATALRVFTQRQLAAQLELDESTISRAIADKTMVTPRGLFGFDFFFDRGIAGPGFEEFSTAKLRARIVALVAAETQALSDAALASALAAEGWTVARRTIAKYRESLNIPPTSRRRRETGNGRLRGIRQRA